VTGGKVEARIANAEHDSTYLLAKVEVVASYKLAGINRTRMENLFHRLFAPGLTLPLTTVSAIQCSPRNGFSFRYSLSMRLLHVLRMVASLGMSMTPCLRKLVKA
jgi:hypothetical protein